ncbi:hypothetical protein SAMN05880501_10298 [Ureibacillus xyleni]|uniref:Uncharacterized protein n=1 Tax=Ureibacillus xyleni TaxID=614648 RepID=A0A285S180_9BACL|nr:hypothetical protein [Ureibacillus xyleni]SOB98789.1 hypothetical protein SAMN05880501_10298 [Ureibacillus xyleni]
MKKGNLFKLLLAFTLIFSISLPLVNETANAAANVSYMLNKKKVYTYKDYSINKTYEAKYDKKQHEEIAFYELQSDGKGFTCYTDYKCYSENKEGLYKVELDDNELLKYPVKVNKTWETSYGETRKITAIKTIKVKAGTYKNVVVVKVTKPEDKKAYSIEYYAPNVGLILKEVNNSETKYKTTKQLELIKVK